MSVWSWATKPNCFGEETRMENVALMLKLNIIQWCCKYWKSDCEKKLMAISTRKSASDLDHSAVCANSPVNLYRCQRLAPYDSCALRLPRWANPCCASMPFQHHSGQLPCQTLSVTDRLYRCLQRKMHTLFRLYLLPGKSDLSDMFFQKTFFVKELFYDI